jgi:hypothetical protein
LAALCAVLWLWGHRRCCRLSRFGLNFLNAVQIGYRAQQFASITQNNAQVFQVLIG